jgi:hypothetical protein
MKRRGRKGGRKKFEEQQDRYQFVNDLVARRMPYPHIAKAVAKKYDMTLKGAYKFLERMNRRAAREAANGMGEVDLTNVFFQIVSSLQQTIFQAKQDNNHAAVISGEQTLARLFGFDKGTFLAALQEAKQRRAKVVDNEIKSEEEQARNLLAADMNNLTNKQLQAMIGDEDIQEVLDMGHGEDLSKIEVEDDNDQET